MVAGQRRRPHRRATAASQEPRTASKTRTSDARTPASATASRRAVAKQERWQQWRLVCLQAVLQRVRDAERRKQERQAQAWADGQDAPDARGDNGQREDEAGSSTEATARTGQQSPPHGAAATRDTQTNTEDNNVNNNRPKRGLNTVVSYDETNRRTRRRTPQEREAYIRDRKRKNVALIPTGARIVRMRTAV